MPPTMAPTFDEDLEVDMGPVLEGLLLRLEELPAAPRLLVVLETFAIEVGRTDCTTGVPSVGKEMLE